MSDNLEAFIHASSRLNGQIVKEREPWNTEVTADAIRHYAWGTSDDNPLWLDPDYSKRCGNKKILAPPGFVCSVLYPFLHGAPIETELKNLISEISIEWFDHLRQGDKVSAQTKQLKITESIDRNNRALVIIPAETNWSCPYKIGHPLTLFF